MNPNDLHFTNISTGTPKMIKKESHRYCIIPLEIASGGQNIGPLSLKFDAKMKIFKHATAGNNSYSTAPFFRIIGNLDGRKLKQRIKDNLELEGVPLDGIVVLQLKQIFCGNIKSLTCVVQEVLVEQEIHLASAFDEYEDV